MRMGIGGIAWDLMGVNGMLRFSRGELLFNCVLLATMTLVLVGAEIGRRRKKARLHDSRAQFDE